MIEIINGNLLTAPVEALVNTVNTEGVMGKGIALQFKQAFPAMYKAYELACKSGEVKLGKVHIFDLGGLVGGPKWIINFPTKGHWKSRSRLSDIEKGLTDLVTQVEHLQIRSIAVPPLGCGYGGLNWEDVRPLIEAAFAKLPEVDVKLFPPNGAPEPKAMPNRTTKPDMTKGRAALIVIMDRYLQGLLDPFVSLLEIHKLMYFLQESGEPLKLRYEAKSFGPYAENLRQVLIKLEGHYLSGYGEGQDSPDKPIELLPGAVETASEFILPHSDTLARMDRVTALISGFEDPYGMELLSSVHWVMCAEKNAQISADDAIAAVHRWNSRKQKNLKPEHLRKAWNRLKEQHWDSESRNALHL
jgi:O-acetyl-ADP-ribose deacetylase (regulator of RNase III)